MKFLEHVLASLLTFALSTAILGFILGSTLGNAKFLETAATKADLYTQLAATIPDVAASGSETPADTKTALHSVLTATFLQQQTEMLLPQLVDHYGKGGPAPQIDLSDLVTRLQAAGYPMTPDMAASLGSPQTVTAGPADARLTNLASLAARYGWVAPAASLALILLIVAVMRERRWSTLIRAAAWAAVTLAVSGGLLLLVPSLATSGLGGSALKPLLPAVTSLLRAITDALARDLFIAAGVVAAIAVALGLIHGFGRIKAKFTRAPKTPKSKTPPPTPA